MAENTKKQTKMTDEVAGVHGKVLLSWTFPEYPVYFRSENWFFWMGLLGGILIIYSVFTGNFLFAIIIVLTALIMFAHSHTRPQTIEFQATQDGIKIGESFYRYKELKDFWILYEPPEVKTLYFDFKSTWRPHMGIPLQNEDPVKVRRLLVKYLPEDLTRDTEPFSDSISRLLKM